MLQILQQRTSGFKLGVLLPIMFMAVTWHGLHMGPSNMDLTRKASFKDTFVHRYATRKAPSLCSRIVFRTVVSLDVSTQTVFLYYMSNKCNLRGFLWCFLVSTLRTGCYVNGWNQYNFSTLHRLYIRGHRWILILRLMSVDWYKYSNTNIGGSKCILIQFWCTIWRPKAIFDQNVHIT